MMEEHSNINLTLSAFEAGVLTAVLIKDQVLHLKTHVLLNLL